MGSGYGHLGFGQAVEYFPFLLFFFFFGVAGVVNTYLSTNKASSFFDASESNLEALSHNHARQF